MGIKSRKKREAREFDVLIKKRQSAVIDSLNDETEELWKQAYTHRQWIAGEPITLPNGDKVDMAMFDMIVATMHLQQSDMRSMLTLLQKFWGELYPYVENLLNHLNHYKVKFKELYGVEERTLRNFALQNLELQCRQLFMKEAAERTKKGETFDLEEEFQQFHKEFKEKSDAEIAKIKEEEDKRIEEDLKEEERRAALAKTKAFETKLMNKNAHIIK